MKKNIFVLLVLCCLLCGCRAGADGAAAPEATPTPAATATPVPTPVPLDGPMVINLPAELSDDDAETWVGGSVVFHHEERKIGSLYIEWGYTPGQWTMTADGETLTGGHNGYLHEYVEFDTPVSTVTIQALAPICEAYAFEAGSNIPDWVQVWQPPYEDADMLVVPTHADDEHVFFGGTMPYYAGELGYKVQVVYLTNHWEQSPRPHELLDGLWTVGIRHYPVIGPFADRWAKDVEQAHERFDYVAIVEFLVGTIRRFQPEVIVGHDLDGEYGHGVHILNAWGLTEAVEYAADSSLWADSAQQYGTWDTPKLYLHLYKKNEIIMDWEQPLSAFGGKTAFQMAVEGFACHESQAGTFYVYGEGEDYDCHRFGLYRSLVGPDVEKKDMFENTGLEIEN